MVTLSYDIFRRGAAGDHVWVEAARDLESAKSRIIELSAEKPGQYLVFSQRTGRMVSSGTVVASSAVRTTDEPNRVTQPGEGCADAESETLWK